MLKVIKEFDGRMNMKISTIVKNMKYLAACVGLVVYLGACDKNVADCSDKIYLFWQQGCSHCHHAIDFIDEKYPNLPVEKLDLAKESSRAKLIQIAHKYHLSDQIGTPLFVFDGEVMMGWSPSVQEKFVKKAEKRTK